MCFIAGDAVTHHTVPVRLISLKGMPDDELRELRDLLHANDIDFYETPAGNWGISLPAVWLHDKSQLQLARRLVEQYQTDRFSRARNDYEALKREGKNRTLVDEFKDNPGRLVAYIVAAALIIYLSVKPFVDLGK